MGCRTFSTGAGEFRLLKEISEPEFDGYTETQKGFGEDDRPKYRLKGRNGKYK
jgi:hypothetical protein